MKKLYPGDEKGWTERYSICHGGLNQHHILMGRDYVAVTGFGRMHLGLQVEDLYYFMRKVMEKHNWDCGLGNGMLEAYERVLPMSPDGAGVPVFHVPVSGEILEADQLLFIMP